MTNKLILSPGPTKIPTQIWQAMSKEILHHRTKEFSIILKETITLLKKIYQTQNDILLLNSSGTGAMEAAIVNSLNTKDKILIIRAGKFGERWGEIAENHKLKPVYLDLNWGEKLNIKNLEKKIKENQNLKAILCQHCETSTGTIYNIKQISNLTKNKNILTIIDAISSLVVHKCETDKWDLDIVISSSQKAFMLPPGLSIISFSKRAWQRYKKSNLSKFYFDLQKEKQSLEKNTTYYTPAINLIAGLNKSLKIITSIGIKEMNQYYKIIANIVRKAAISLNLSLYSQNPCNSLTAIKVPKEIEDGNKIIKIMNNKHKIIISGGQGKLKGKIFRIGHLGYIKIIDILEVFKCLELTLKDLGYKIKLGSSIKTIENEITKNKLNINHF